MDAFKLPTSDRNLCESILREHSVTYYNSAKLFPKEIQTAVFALYAWLRTADEYVDDPKKNSSEAIYEFEKLYFHSLNNFPGSDRVTNIFIRLVKHFNFKDKWIQAFLTSMKLDLETQNFYKTKEELQRYIFGSAEVVGLMMARIMGVEGKHLAKAQKLGYWMQLVNFLRDIKEDFSDRNRVYIPLSTLEKYNLSPINMFQDEHRHELRQLILTEALHLKEMIPNIEKSVKYVPKNCRFAIRLSIYLYSWTIAQIIKEPLVVLEKQVKPSKLVIFSMVCKNYIKSIFE